MHDWLKDNLFYEYTYKYTFCIIYDYPTINISFVIFYTIQNWLHSEKQYNTRGH